MAWMKCVAWIEVGWVGGWMVYGTIALLGVVGGWVGVVIILHLGDCYGSIFFMGIRMGFFLPA